MAPSSTDPIGFALGAPPRRTTVAPLRTVAQAPLPATAMRPLVRPGTYTPLAAIAAQAAKKKKAKPRSLWQQISDTATNIVPGVIKLAEVAAKSSPMAMTERAIYRAANGRPLLSGPTGGLSEYNPLADQMAHSFISTGQDVIHPTRFARASREGHIVDKVLEDAGNVSMVAGPVGKALGVAGEAAEGAGYARLGSALDTAANVAERVHQVTGPIADSPISIPRRIISFAGENARRGINALAESDLPGQGFASTVRDFAPLRLTEQGRTLREAVGDSSAGSARANARVNRDLFNKAGLFDKTEAARPTMAEQGAATALMNGVGGVDDLIRQSNPHVDPEMIRRSHVLHDVPEQTMTPDVHDVVRSYQDGTLDPASRARVDWTINAIQEEAGKITDRGLGGAGRPKGPLDPRWLGDDPIDEYVMKNLEEAGVPRTQLDMLDQARAAGAKWTDLERMVPELTDVLDNPMSYPKAWRPGMRSAALANEAVDAAGNPLLSSRVPVRPEELLAEGVERPQYFSSKPSPLVQPIADRVGRERANLGTAGVKGLSSENISTNNQYGPYSLRTVGEALGRDASGMEYNRHLVEGIQNAGLGTVRSVLGDQATADIVDQAKREASAQRFSTTQTNRLVGSRLSEALAEQGHSVFDGDLTDPQSGDFNPDAGTDFARVGPDTNVLPTGTKNKLVQYYAPKGGGIPAKVTDWINKKFKGNVLPFSARWQMGDVVGGAFMSWVGGGVNPAELIDSMRRLKHIDPVGVEEMFNHPDFADQSLSQGENQVVRQGPDAPQPKTPIGKFKQISFKVNNQINELNRHAYLLAKTDRLLAEHGLSVDKLGGDQAAWEQPQVQHAVTTAVHDAMKVMGSFDEMTPFEQRFMKRIFPFYAWNRHITALAFRTAIDNPARIMWTLRLGSYGTDPDQDLPSWLKGSIPLGGKLIPTNFINPFNDVAGGSPIYTPAGAMKAMSPAIKLGAAALTGADFDRGGLQLTRPFGTGNTDAQGHDSITPLMFRPAELAYRAARILPLSRIAMDVAPTGTHAGIGFGPHPRYGSGAPMVLKGSGKPIASDSRYTKAAGLFGIPVPSSAADAAAIQASGQQRKKVTSLKVKKVKLG